MINKKNIISVTLFLFLLSCQGLDKNKLSIKDVATIDSGLKEEYYDNGDLKFKVKLDKGIEHGQYLEFYKNKKIAVSGIKIKGKKNNLWKKYDSLGNLSSAVHYYNDSIISHLDINDFLYKKKRLGKNISLSIPEKWKVIEGVLHEQVLLSMKKVCDSEILFCPSLTVTYEFPVNIDKELSSYLKKSDSLLNVSFNNYKVLKEREYYHDSTLFYEKIYLGNIQGVNLGAVTTFVFSKDKTYILTGIALNEKREDNSFLRYEGLFKDIMYSLELKK